MISIHRTLAGSPTPNEISNGYPNPRVTLDYYHSTLSLCDNHVRVFSSLGHKTFRPTLRASYIHIEISEYLPGSLTPSQKFRIYHGSLTPTQKFWITPRVSYTLTEIRDCSPGLLHPHRNSGSLPRSLTPTQKFGTPPRVSYTLTEI